MNRLNFTRDSSIAYFKLGEEGILINDKKKRDIQFSVNGISFITKQFNSEVKLCDEFIKNKEVFCSKTFDDTPWGDCEETKRYSIILLPNGFVKIIKL